MSYINYKDKDIETLGLDVVRTFVNVRRENLCFIICQMGFNIKVKYCRYTKLCTVIINRPMDWYNCYTIALKSLNFKSGSEGNACGCTKVKFNCFSLTILFLRSTNSLDKRLLISSKESVICFQLKIRVDEGISFPGIKIIRD